MYGNAVAKVGISQNETYYVSPIYKKDKIKPIDKVKAYKGKNISRISQLNKLKMKELFDNLSLENCSPLVYNEEFNIQYISEYIFMGKYVDDYI
jgi:hypothetical protein